MNFKGEYFLGLDIGTDSVGYAATDNRYKLLKFKGEPMWGSHLFDPANQCADRRGFRTARRRLDRRQQRVNLVDEILLPEVVKIDPDYYIRKKESALYKEDKSTDTKYIFFNDENYTDAQFHKDYPTIHHLICDLMLNKEKKFDIRLINIALDWLVAHRGHFLSEVGTDNIDKVMDFSAIYYEFMDLFDNDEKPWDAINPEDYGKILKIKGIDKKKKALKEFLYGNSIPTEEYFLDRKTLIAFIAGGKVQCNKLFVDSDYEDELKITISEDMETVLPQLNDEDADYIAKMAAMYDWSVLSDILSGNQYISKAKVEIYEQHKTDLMKLKRFVRKYAHDKYSEIFRKSANDLCNYVAYVYNADSIANEKKVPKKKASAEDFYNYLKKAININNIICDCDEDKDFLENMILRMGTGDFLPKQITSDNRVIPYQLYYVEYKTILENAKQHYSFLKEIDSDGYSNMEKLESIFTYKIPYYVGPLRNDGDKSKYSWVVRKASGKVYPWNFNEKIDLDESEDAFIRRMTNTCTYIPGKDVLPKWSLLYTKYNVLNEINNLKCNGKEITVEVKQSIFTELFEKRLKVTPKAIKEYMVCNGIMLKDDILSGVDDTIKSSLKSAYEFRHLIDKKVLTADDVERIISRRTYAEDNRRYKDWLKKEYPQLNEDDFKYVSKLKYKEFGRLSAFFLNGLEGTDKTTGEIGTIMHFLWNTNDNLMQLLSNKYTFIEEISKIRQEYYLENRLSLNEQMDNLGISNAVKRPVTRTLAVVKDIVSAVGYAPKKIFVEMARGADDVKKRSVSRKNQIINLYKSIEADTSELEKQLEEMGDTANNRLQSDALFLYFMQLGKCMYSGEPLDISLLKTDAYNIDHIWPQSLVKDDSLLHNRVLVLSKINGDKSDVYPINKDIRHNMASTWKMFLDNKLITKEKYERLIRSTPFTENEKLGFINRQLVETRQSMKAVTQLLNNLYPQSEIVYVKARLASEFRQVYNLAPKARMINDLHHAKDAYLNIVTGNVYNERFTKKWFNVNEKYSMKIQALFGNDIKHGENIIWDSKKDIDMVKRTYAKNNIHLTKYAYCQKGGFFDQMPVKKGLGQASLKAPTNKEDVYSAYKNIDKYGGYNKLTASFFVVVRYLRGGKKEVSVVPVDLMISERFLKDNEFALSYIQEFLEGINTKRIENIELPLGKRIVKIKSILSLDGYKVWLNGKSNGGKQLLISSAESLKLDEDKVKYIKRIENYLEKKKINTTIKHDENYDGLCIEKNIAIYDELISKLESIKYKQMPGNQGEIVKAGKELFVSLDFDTQINVINSCVSLLKSGRSGGCDLSDIGGKSSSGVMVLGSNLSSAKYKDVRLIDVSPAGIFENQSINLMELLK